MTHAVFPYICAGGSFTVERFNDDLCVAVNWASAREPVAVVASNDVKGVIDSLFRIRLVL